MIKIGQFALRLGFSGAPVGLAVARKSSYARTTSVSFKP